jgi:hypothetical protein
MTDRVLLGSVAAKLEANGYIPSSVSAPGKRDYRYVDDEAGILLMANASSEFEDYSKRRVAALIVGTRNADALAILRRAKLDGGPQRIASDGSITFVLKYDNSYGSLWTRKGANAPGETQPAVILVGEERINPHLGEVSPPNVLRVGGTWKNGDLLSVPRANLPQLSDADALFESIDALLLPAYMRERAKPKDFTYERPTMLPAKELTAAERELFKRGIGRASHRDICVAKALAADDSSAD